MKWLMLLAIVCCCGSCESVNDTAFSTQLVVQGILYANEPLDSIVVRKTIAIDDPAPSDRVTDATVTISTPDTTFTLHEDRSTSVRGRYVTSGSVIVKPGVTYNLRIAALGLVLTSTTTVPLPIRLDSVKHGDKILSVTNVDTLGYPSTVDSLSTPAVHQWWSESPGCAGYAVEAMALDTSDMITDDLNSSLPDSSAYGRYRYFIYSTSEEVVWLQFKYWNLNMIRALALDRNYQDFVLGLYLSKTQFNNNTLHVQGGLGVFGSAARTKKLIFLKDYRK